MTRPAAISTRFLITDSPVIVRSRGFFFWNEMSGRTTSTRKGASHLQPEQEKRQTEGDAREEAEPHCHFPGAQQADEGTCRQPVDGAGHQVGHWTALCQLQRAEPDEHGGHRQPQQRHPVPLHEAGSQGVRPLPASAQPGRQPFHQPPLEVGPGLQTGRLSHTRPLPRPFRAPPFAEGEDSTARTPPPCGPPATRGTEAGVAKELTQG